MSRTKGQALHDFFNRFGIPGYPATNVPNDATFPWLTYDAILDSWSGGEVGLTVNLWYHTESEAIPNAKAEEVARAIGLGGAVLPCDGGYIWLKRGSPWCQPLRDEVDENIKRRYLNVTAEFFTQN